ncbi:MAG: right-handed parallel beta-helix repeat-containing protein, partial [Phycisphaerae bacterium]
MADSSYSHGVLLGDGLYSAEPVYRILLPPPQTGSNEITSITVTIEGRSGYSPEAYIGPHGFLGPFDLSDDGQHTIVLAQSTVDDVVDIEETGLAYGLDITIEVGSAFDIYDLKEISVKYEYSGVPTDTLKRFQEYYSAYRSIEQYEADMVDSLWNTGQWTVSEYFYPACQESLALADNLSSLSGSPYGALKGTIDVLENFQELMSILEAALDYTVFWINYTGPSKPTVSTRLTSAANSLRILAQSWVDRAFDGSVSDADAIFLNGKIGDARDNLTSLRSTLRDVVFDSWWVWAYGSGGTVTAEIMLNSLTPLLNVAYGESSVSTEPSFVTGLIDTLVELPDTGPPSPNPMTWSTEPYETGTNSIAMTATTATDPSGIEYYFDETTGSSGGSDSGWQTSRTYTDAGLSPDTTYCYRVKARDKSSNQNETSYSVTRCATTDPEPNNPPDPPTLVSPPDDAQDMSLTPLLQASAFSDPDPGDWHASSQWQVDDDSDFSSPGYDSGETATNKTEVTVASGRLTFSTAYFWRVRYKDNRGAWSDWSSSWSFSTMAAPGPVLYVDADATGANDGSSWADAYTDLQDALAVAREFPSYVNEIWVAAGTYTPAPPGGDREATFRLINGVGLYGGFAGWETSRDQRDWTLNETTLSGDLNGDDIALTDPTNLPDEATRAENSYHVVAAWGTDATAVLDGFTITGGNADGLSPEERNGGGMYNYNGSPTVTNCTFSGNSARWGGGGMDNGYYSSPTLTNCTFSGNSALGGGGMCGTATLENCTFSGNSATYGGGMYNWGASSPMVTNCTFSGNSAVCGGGMYTQTATLTNCTFTGNAASIFGGGMCNNGSPTLANCTFSGNSATYGGGMCNRYGDTTLANCTFSHNSADFAGGGMCSFGWSTLAHCTFSHNSAGYAGGGMYKHYSGSRTVTNCILWGNTRASGVRDESAQISVISEVTYSCIEGWGGAGTGNIGRDPFFVDADGPDDIPGTEDDDLRLTACSPCNDSGDNAAVPDDVTTDLDGNPRIHNGIVDMGAYEFEGVAEPPPPPAPEDVAASDGDYC